LGRPGLPLVVLSVVEQRLDAGPGGAAGATVNEVAAAAGCHARHCTGGSGVIWPGNVAGLTDWSHRPTRCPHQALS
jgi:hypothetical protein